MKDNLDPPIDLEEAKRILAGPYGKELIKIAEKCTAPIFWNKSNSLRNPKLCNGTIFFLDTGERKFAVSAYHVYEGYHQDLLKNPKIQCQIANLNFNPKDRIIDFCPMLDIVTFDISKDEINDIKKDFFVGHQKSWPPEPPQIGKGVFFLGYPGNERKEPDENNRICFGSFNVLSAAESVSDKKISIQLSQDKLLELKLEPPLKKMPENYNACGISGAALITIVQSPIFYWRLGGVIYEADSKTGLTFATRADYILPDGTLRKNDF